MKQQTKQLILGSLLGDMSMLSQTKIKNAKNVRKIYIRNNKERINKYCRNRFVNENYKVQKCNKNKVCSLCGYSSRKYKYNGIFERHKLGCPNKLMQKWKQR